MLFRSALVGFGGLAHSYGLQMLLIAAGNVWLGTWAVYRFLAWPTRRWQRTLEARTPAQLLAVGHGSPLLGKGLALIFVIFLGVYASAVIKGAAQLESVSCLAHTPSASNIMDPARTELA